MHGRSTLYHVFFQNLCVFVYVFVCSLFFRYMPDSFYPVCIFGVCPVYFFINMATSLLLMSDLRIISFNTQGLQGINKRIDVLEYLKDKNFHIYCLQDTHFTKDDVDKTKVQWGEDYNEHL